MTESRKDVLQNKINTLKDAILYAEHHGDENLEDARSLLMKVEQFYDQGTWSTAEKLLENSSDITRKGWYCEFVEKREHGKFVSGEHKRFQDDGLCQKYGHIMFKVKLSNVRWYYECRICKKQGKSQTLK